MAGESMEEAGRLRRLQATYQRAWIGAAAADGDDKREDEGDNARAWNFGASRARPRTMLVGDEDSGDRFGSKSG